MLFAVTLKQSLELEFLLVYSWSLGVKCMSLLDISVCVWVKSYRACSFWSIVRVRLYLRKDETHFRRDIDIR